jgi:hypothetical protein
MNPSTLAEITVIHDGEMNLVGAVIVTGIISGLIAAFFFRSRRPLIAAWVVLWGGMLAVYVVTEDRSERERIRLHDESERRRLGLPIPPRSER